MLVAAIALSGCAGEKAAELLDTAKFEELQNNKEHAVQLYEEIIKSYPDSEQAKIAKDRLSALKPGK
jgi:TolA-binding protein